jgi:GT2 family glycosyltransferase
MEGQDARASVIIVSWNTRERLKTCLAHLFRASGDLACEVFVVDNASSDGSAAMVREHYPWVRLIENQDNVGFARGCNQAMRLSNAEYVLLLNPDTEVSSGSIAELLRFMDADPRLGAVGPRLLNTDGTLQAWCFPAPTLGREVWRMFHLDAIRCVGIYDMERWDWSAPRQVDTVPGTCFLVRRNALAQVGLLDEDYFIYSEEVDLCQRLRRGGWSIYWDPRAVVLHHGGESTRQVARAMFVRLYQGKILYFRKHHGPMAAATYKLILGAAAAARLLATPAIWLEPPVARSRHKLLLGHYGQLLRALPGL